MSTNPIMKKAFFTTGGGGGTTLPTYESGKFLTNDGTNLSWSANGAGDLLANGTVPLTANWPAGAFNISAQTLTTTETLGAETVADFSTWTAAAGWTFGTGKWTHSSGTTTLEDDKTSPAYDAGASYKMVVAVTHAGTGSLLLGLVNKNLKYVSSSGTYTIYFRAIGDLEDVLLFTPATGWTGSVDSVSIKKVTGNYVTSGNCVFGPDQIIVPHSTHYYPAIAFGAYNGFGLSSTPLQLNLFAGSTYGLTVYSDYYSRFNCLLNNASGNEYALGVVYETSKAAGNDYGLYIHQTDSVSGGSSYLIFADVADVATMFTVDNTGVIGSATWQGVAVAAGYGGTGQSSYAVGDLLYASGATALSKLADVATGQVLVSGGVGAAPAWSASPSLSGQVARLVPVLALTDGATQAIDATQCRNFTIHNGSVAQAIEIDLPAAAVGMQINVIVAAAYTIKIDPNGSDQIMVVTSTAGDYYISDAVIGTSISLVCIIANKWHVVGENGTWTEE